MKAIRLPTWLGLAALGVGSAAQAADPIPLDAICVDGEAGTRTVSARLLRGQLLQSAGVSWTLLDIDGDGSISPRETFAALAYEQFCEANAVRENSRARSVACKSEENGKFRQARNSLREFARHPQVRFVQIAQPSPTDPMIQQGLRLEELWPLLDDRGRFVRMECAAASPDTDESGSGGSDIARGFRLRKNPEDLTIVPTPGLKNIAQAEISYTDDNVANTETFRVHGTAGFVIPVGGNHSLIPFVQFIRSHVEDTTGANAPQETAKLTVGALSSWQLSSFNVVDVAPLYVNDLEDGAEFVSLRVGWRPGFLYGLPTFQVGRRFLCPRSEIGSNGDCGLGQYLALRTDARVIATAGRVIDVGQNPQLVANRNYVRLGGEARVTLFGLRGIVRDLSVDATYRHLFSLDGDPNNLSAFSAGVNYWIGGSPNASIRYGYERRTDEDTLKRTNQWTIAFGLRF